MASLFSRTLRNSFGFDAEILEKALLQENNHLNALSSINEDDISCLPQRQFGEEKFNGRGKVFRSADAPQGIARCLFLRPLIVSFLGVVTACDIDISIDSAWIDAIDADLVLSQFLGKVLCEGIKARFA